MSLASQKMNFCCIVYVDFNQQFIETELYDAKPTYKKFSSYRPGVKEKNVSSMITYGYDTAYCLKSHCGVRGCCRQKWVFLPQFI
jgi:hypothetical protein